MTVNMREHDDVMADLMTGGMTIIGRRERREEERREEERSDMERRDGRRCGRKTSS